MDHFKCFIWDQSSACKFQSLLHVHEILPAIFLCLGSFCFTTSPATSNHKITLPLNNLMTAVWKWEHFKCRKHFLNYQINYSSHSSPEQLISTTQVSLHTDQKCNITLLIPVGKHSFLLVAHQHRASAVLLKDTEWQLRPMNYSPTVSSYHMTVNCFVQHILILSDSNIYDWWKVPVQAYRSHDVWHMVNVG